MRIGTKSILFGGHQFLLHPLFVAWAWWKLYGFPWDPRLWVAFFVHDLGYWGKPNMDGVEGERHVEFGAEVMCLLFDWKVSLDWVPVHTSKGAWVCGPWGQFCLFHSRFYSKKHDRPFSRLCVADKLVPAIMPRWLYLTLVRWSGELDEYMAQSGYLNPNGKYAEEPKLSNKTYDLQALRTGDATVWYQILTDYVTAWVEEHKDGRPDTWTPSS